MEQLEQLTRALSEGFQKPRNFLPAGTVLQAKACETPAFIKAALKRKKGGKGAKYSGRLYERRVQRKLCEEHEYYLPGVWFNFRDVRGKWRFCQPDGLLVDYPRRRLTIVEIKVTHTELAWWQTRLLYEPVVRSLFSETLWPNLQVLEVCRNYQPISFPERFKFTGDANAVPNGGFGVMLMRV